MKIAIVYDWIDKWGGVERVLLYLCKMYPMADFYTSYFDRQNAPWAKGLNIKTSFINNLPDFIKKNRLLSLPLYPYAFESFNFGNYDLVISVTSSFAKAIITQPKTRHICYLLTPTRFLWSHEANYLKGFKKLFSPYINYLKKWDKTVAQRPDKIISISQTVADRCLRYYGRKSEVVYPPFENKYWANIKSEIRNSKLQINTKFFLVVSRLEPYKKVELAVNVFNKLSDNLIIVGKGTEERRLKQLAGKNIRFIKDIGDKDLAYLYSKAQALIMPQEEDFGYVSLEAQFFGCPVIYYQKGGATETIIDGKTGLSFTKQSVSSLKDALERFSAISYNLKENALKFGKINSERFNQTRFVI